MICCTAVESCTFRYPSPNAFRTLISKPERRLTSAKRNQERQPQRDRLAGRKCADGKLSADSNGSQISGEQPDFKQSAAKRSNGHLNGRAEFKASSDGTLLVPVTARA